MLLLLLRLLRIAIAATSSTLEGNVTLLWPKKPSKQINMYGLTTRPL